MTITPKHIEALLATFDHHSNTLVISAADIARAEEKLNVRLPPDYVALISALNGVEFPLFELLRVVPPASTAFRHIDIVDANFFQWLNWKMPADLIALKAEGNGDYVCIRRSLQGLESTKVFLWQHNAIDEEEAVSLVADSIEEWLHAEIDEAVPR